jgi:hypothetical protein
MRGTWEEVAGLLGKQVRVVVETRELFGYLYCVDPVLGHLVLIEVSSTKVLRSSYWPQVKEGRIARSHVCFGHAISSIEEDITLQHDTYTCDQLEGMMNRKESIQVQEEEARHHLGRLVTAVEQVR